MKRCNSRNGGTGLLDFSKQRNNLCAALRSDNQIGPRGKQFISTLLSHASADDQTGIGMLALVFRLLGVPVLSGGKTNKL